MVEANQMAKKGDGITSDIATGKRINGEKPEEIVRQQYETILNEDYGYDYDLMDIEVHVVRGSKKPSGPDERADIVIYDSSKKRARDQFKNMVGIIETKRPERKDGLKQLASYMSATSCVWGVWTNGEEIEYLYKEPDTGQIRTDFIFQIPRYGESLKDMGKRTKDKLRPTNNLKIIFRRMLNLLYTNTNISRREKLGNELIRIIFAKIWDEKYYPQNVPQFRVGIEEDPEDVRQRIIDVFEDVKRELAGDGVFDVNETITLDAASMRYVVGELENYSLLKTSKDVVGDAFEVFAESKLVGEKGEFFTPREVVKTAVEIAKPRPEQMIFDPACGSGGFLIYALEYVWNAMERSPKYRGSRDLKNLKADMAKRCFFGIDKEIDLVKIAKAYMAIVGDGKGKITQQNTLHRPEDFEGYSKKIFTRGTGRQVEFEQFDMIFTNPPFGSKISVLKAGAGAFELGNAIKNGKKTPKNTPPQELFIERCLQMLKDGGTLAIVLPETYFHAPSKKRIRDFMFGVGDDGYHGHNIKAIVDLPHDTFRPHNNAKTILVVLEKSTEQQENIVMAVAEGIGHDALGRPLYRYDYELQKPTTQIWDDTIQIRKEIKRPADPNNKYVFMIKIDEIVDDIYIPRYYWGRKRTEIEKEADRRGYKLVPMSELVDTGALMVYDGHGSPNSVHKGKGDIPYIRVADIVNWEVYKNPTAMIPENEYARVKGKNGIDLRPGDVLFVRRGSYRIGTVACVTDSDLKVLLTRELKVFRVFNSSSGLTPEYLVFLLSHDLVQRQMNGLTFIDTTLPNIAERWMDLRLPFSKDGGKADDIKPRMRRIFKLKQAVISEIESISKEYGNLTT